MKYKLMLLSVITVVVLFIAGCNTQPGKSAFAGKATGFSDSGCVKSEWWYQDAKGNLVGKGKTGFVGCTDYDSAGQPWCPTTTVQKNGKQVYVSGSGAWQYCSKEESSLLVATPATSVPKLVCMVFESPFYNSYNLGDVNVYDVSPNQFCESKDKNSFATFALLMSSIYYFKDPLCKDLQFVAPYTTLLDPSEVIADNANVKSTLSLPKQMCKLYPGSKGSEIKSIPTEDPNKYSWNAEPSSIRISCCAWG